MSEQDRDPSRRSTEAPEVTIERIVPGGLGLAHLNGKVVLTPYTASGDRVRIRIVREQERVAFGEVQELIEAGPDRVDPPCPYYGRCGGCDMQHLNYRAQLDVKSDIVQDSLRRIAAVIVADVPIVPSPDPWRYRTRAEWQYDAAHGALGYFASGTRAVVDVSDCLVASLPLATTLSTLRKEISDVESNAAAKELHAAEANGRVSVLPAIGDLRAHELVREVSGYHYRYDAACFFQANAGLLPALVEEAMRFAEARPNTDLEEQSDMPRRSMAVDLYCGVGLFALPLATRFDRVAGVEVHAHAANFARRNLQDAKVENARIAVMPVDRWLATRGQSIREPDMVMLNPPRSGLDPSAMAGLVRLNPWRITYVSCDPATLARDLKRMLSAKFELIRVAALDMFPQTHHVEVVAHLQRGI